MKNKFFIKEYCIIIFWLLVILSRIYYFILHCINKENIFVLLGNIIILLFDIGVLLNLIGKIILVGYLLMLLGFIGHIILNKYINFAVIIFDGLVCVVLISEFFYKQVRRIF